VGQAWWRRLPPLRIAAWVVATFLILSLASALMTRLDTPGIVAVAGLAGVVDARAWYGLTTAAVRATAEQPPNPWQWHAALWRIRQTLRHRTTWVPMAPLAAVVVLALVVGMARLAFTGTVRFASGPGGVSVGAVTGDDLTGPGGGASTASAKAVTGPSRISGAVLVVEGFGSTCCHSANSLRAAEPNLLVRQFSYQGLNAAGQPIPYRRAGNMSLQVLGDRMAAQVEKLYRLAGTPVDVVAESEGTLGLYAMLARHPHLPVRSVVLLSPIVQPGQLGQAGGTVPGAALTTLNNLVGGMSPYGSSGAQELINSVSEVGGRYFQRVSRDRGLSWLAVVPLADAVTLPACPMPQNVIFVDAFHGGLLGDPSVRRIVAAFLAGDTPSDRDLDAMAGGSQRDLRSAASLIAAAAAAWRMPDLHAECVGS